MAPPVQHHGRRKAGRAAAHNGHPFSGTHPGRAGLYPAGGKGPFNNGLFIFLCGYRILMKTAGTCGLAQGRADPSRKLGKTVGLFQTLIGLLPFSPVYQVIGLRNQVVERTAGGHASHKAAKLAERHAALHTPGPLAALLLGRKGCLKFIKMPNPCQGRLSRGILAFIF